MIKVNWNDVEKIKEVVAQSLNISDVIKNLNLKNYRNNRLKVKSFCVENSVSTIHFNTIKNKKITIWQEKPLEEIFVEKSKADNKFIKEKLIKYNILKYKCAICPLSNKWKGKELTLHLDHINGVNDDNRKKTLRFLCPNCHSQQPTSNKGSERKKKLEKEKLKPQRIFKYKIEWPDDKDFQILLNTYPMSILAKKLNIADRAIAKRARKRNLIIPTDVHGKGYWLKKIIKYQIKMIRKAEIDHIIKSVKEKYKVKDLLKLYDTI